MEKANTNIPKGLEKDKAEFVAGKLNSENRRLYLNYGAVTN